MNRLVLVGFKGSGKNTVGEYLVEKYDYVGISFADALKDTVAAIFSWDRAALEGSTAESRIWRETIDTWWANKLGIPEFTPRWALMNIGTDIFREHFDQNIWVYNVERRLKQHENKNVVVFDGRFKNEIRLVTNNNGKAIRVKRGPEPEWFGDAIIANGCMAPAPYKKILKDKNVHPSEYSWIGEPLDYTIENDNDIVELHKKVDEYLDTLE